MQVALIASIVIVLSAGTARAENMVATNSGGIMCRDAKSLAEFTAHGGGLKPHVMDNPFSPTAKRYMTNCADAGSPVHVITMRKNTSIVTYRGATWYVPNIDYFTPPPNCLKDGSHITLAGNVESATAAASENDPTKVYHYPRLTLDAEVCFLGNVGEPAGRYVSLDGTSEASDATLMRMIGHHVTVSGVLTTPEMGNQPPDNMMLFDATVKKDSEDRRSVR